MSCGDRFAGIGQLQPALPASPPAQKRKPDSRSLEALWSKLGSAAGQKPASPPLESSESAECISLEFASVSPFSWLKYRCSLLLRRDSRGLPGNPFDQASPQRPAHSNCSNRH